MSLTQKRLLQIPLFLFITFLMIIPLEWTIFSRLPFRLGPIQLLPIVMTYFALTRSFIATVFWGVILGFLSTFSLPFAFGAAIAAQSWATISAKLITYLMPFDSPILFGILVCTQSVIYKILWRVLSSGAYKALPWSTFIAENLPSYITLFILSLLIFPILVIWDTFFENNLETSRDLKPTISGIRR